MIHLVNDFAGLTELEPAWWALWQRAAEATPFQSPAWLLPWWRSFCPGRLATAALSRGERLIALAPLYLEPETARLLPIGVGTTDYLDVLLDPSCEAAETRSVLPFLASEVPQWRCCRLEEMAPGAAGLRLAAPPCARDTTAAQSVCPVLDLLRPLPSKIRRDQRQAARRAGALGEVETCRLEGSDPAGFLDRLFALHAARWRGRGETGVLADGRVQTFHREAARRLAAAGLARLIELRIAGRTVACYYGLADRGRWYGYITGFDPDFEEVSPGSLLLGAAVAEAGREGMREFHLLRGGEPYKYAWGAVDRWNRCRIIERRRPDVAG